MNSAWAGRGEGGWSELKAKAGGRVEAREASQRQTFAFLFWRRLLLYKKTFTFWQTFVI